MRRNSGTHSVRRGLPGEAPRSVSCMAATARKCLGDRAPMPDGTSIGANPTRAIGPTDVVLLNDPPVRAPPPALRPR